MKKKSLTVWVVTGSGGEYSDWICWVADTFSTKEQADEFVSKCVEYEKGFKDFETRAAEEEYQNGHPDPYYPKYRPYTGCEWTVMSRTLQA